MILKVENLAKKYSQKANYAIENINLYGNEGEIVGLLGHNGAGKSTTIKCITGIHPYEDGVIELLGYDMKKDSINFKKNFGYVSDEFTLFEKMTGIEFINFMADIYKVSLEERKERIEKFQELFQLGDAIKKSISSYSHGMKQKLCLAASLLHNPDIWILDEPTVGLDIMAVEELKKMIKTLSIEFLILQINIKQLLFRLF